MQDEHGTGAQPLQPNVMELLETAGDLRGSAVQSSQLPHKRLLTPEQFQEALDNSVELKTGQIQQNLGQGLVDAHLMQGHRRLYDAHLRGEQGMLGAAMHATQTTTTGTLLRALQPYLNGTIEPPEHGYTPTLEEYHELATEFNLGIDDHVRNRLMQATSSAQMRRFAQDMSLANEHAKLVGDHWAINLLVHGFDPVENVAMVSLGAVTGGGAAAAGMSLRAARIGHALSSTGAVLGSMHAASELGGTELNTETALLTTGLMLPLTTWTNKAVVGKAYSKFQTKDAQRALDSYEVGSGLRRETEAPTPKERAKGEQPSLQRTAEAAETPAGRAQASLRAKVTHAVKVATDGVAALTKKDAWRMYLPESIRTAQETVPKMLQDTVGEIQQLKTLIKEAGGAHKAPELAQQVKELQAQLRELQGPESVVTAKHLGITPQEYQAAVREAKELQAKDLTEAQAELAMYQQELAQLNKARPPKTEADAILEEVDLVNASTEPQIVADIHDALRAQERAMQEAGASVEDIERISRHAVETAQRQLLTGNVAPSNIAKGMRFFTELMSEHSLVTAGIPEIEKFVTRVLDDPLLRNGLIGESASSNWAVFQRQANKIQKEWDDSIMQAVHERLGRSQWTTFFGYSKKYIDARAHLEGQVASDLLRREGQLLRGEAVTAADDALIAKLTRQYEDMGHSIADNARVAGLGGFKDYMRTAGYFHRSWNWENMNRILANDTDGAMHAALSEGIRRANQQLDAGMAEAIADAIITRTRNKAHGSRNDVMGQVGALELDGIRESLQKGGTDAVYAESIMRRLEQRMEDQGSVKYAKRRIPVDMNIRFVSNGESLRLQDLIDTDLTRLFANYSNGMSGRSALAKVGIGGDTHGIATHVDHYAKLLDKFPQLSAGQKQRMISKYEDVLSDFTGIRKEGQVLGEGMQVLKALSTASMLGSTGLLQIPEMAIGAARQGAVSVTKHMLKEMPGIKSMLTKASRDEQLLKDWFEVTGIDFKTDLRIESWKRQVEMGFPTEGAAIRLATAMQQLTPTVTGQRWVHHKQSDAFLKLHLHTLYKASSGDAKALKTIGEAGELLTPDMLEQIKKNATLNKDGTLNNLNLGALPHKVQDAVMQQITRLQDTVLLHHRPGWGTSYRHSGVGQLVGQFTSYVGLAHNLIMRRTYQHDGVAGLAKVFAYQYPLMLMTSYLNEARKGNILDLDNDDDLKKLAKIALSYSAVIGMFGDAFGLLSPEGQSRSLAAMGPLEGLGGLAKGVGYLSNEEYGKASASVLGTARALSILGAMVGTQALQEALKSIDD